MTQKIALADAIHMLTLANNATPPGREMDKIGQVRDDLQ